jgi:hypothetical protein
MDSKNKLLIIVLAVGVFGFYISNGTWAYIQDTITSKGNTISTAFVQLLVNGNSINMETFEIKNAIPSSNATLIETITLQNNGTSNGRVFVQFIPEDGTFNDANELTIMIGDVTLFSNLTNMASNPVYLNEISQKSIITPNLVYIYTGTKNEKAYKFDLVFSIKATH